MATVSREQVSCPGETVWFQKGKVGWWRPALDTLPKAGIGAVPRKEATSCGPREDGWGETEPARWICSLLFVVRGRAGSGGGGGLCCGGYLLGELRASSLPSESLP